MRDRAFAKRRRSAGPDFQLMASDDPLNRRDVEQVLVGVATRQYSRQAGPLRRR
jgi:hypothetical protein